MATHQIEPVLTWKEGEIHFSVLALPNRGVAKALRSFRNTEYRPRDECVTSLTHLDVLEIRQKGIRGGNAHLCGNKAIRRYVLTPPGDDVRYREVFFVVGTPLEASRWLGVRVKVDERLREELVVFIFHVQFV